MTSTSATLKLFFLAIAAACSLAGCNDETPSVKSVQANKAREAANSLNFTENAEIENIKRRLELTSKPGLLGYVVLLNEMGQPVLYTTTHGKPTSGSKRLTEPDRMDCHANGCLNRAASSDEGTFGSSGEYIFFWTSSGQYIQWNGKYLYSNQPFRLTIQPLVVSTQQTQ